MGGTSLYTEAPMAVEWRTLADLEVTLGELSRHTAQGIPTRITMSLALMMTGLASAGERAILNPRAMLHLLIHGRDAMSWQRGCSSHLSPGSMNTCEFLDTHSRKFRSFLFTSITLRHDFELDIPERFVEVRGRMPPPREEYVYAYSGDPYRPGTSLVPRRDSAYPRQADCYRPGHIEERRWSSSYTLGDSSNSWARQRSPNGTARLPPGRPDYRGVSYEKSLSDSPRSSRISSPRHSRAAASCRPHSPSSSSIRSSRERSKSLPRSRERSLSSVRSSVDSRSYTADPPVRPQVQRSHPVGQFRGRRRGGQRYGMRFHADGSRDPISPHFPPPLTYPIESRPDDRFAAHPSLPLRPPSPHLTPGPGGRNRLPERGFSGPAQSAHNDSHANKGEIVERLPESVWALTNGAGSPFIPASQLGYQLGRSKRKRRGGVNRKKRGLFQQTGSARENFTESNATSLVMDGSKEFAIPHRPTPMDEIETPKDSFLSMMPKHEMSPLLVSKEVPVLALPEAEMKPSSMAENESPPLVALKSEECLPDPNIEAPVSVVANTSPLLDLGGKLSPQNADGQESSPVIRAIPELSKLVIPPSETLANPPPAQHGLLEVSKADSPPQTQSSLFSLIPARVATPPLPPLEPPLEPCNTAQSLPGNGLPEVTTSSPASSVAPTPSLQTPSPPRVAPEVVVAARIVQEPDQELPASPVSSALQAAGVPPVVHPGHDTFSVHAKEAESLAEALRIVVSARQLLDLQSREERVNPVLMANRAIATTPDESAPLADTLVQDVLAGQRAKDTIQAFHSHMRDSLVANMAARQETTDEKIARLRKEYLALHREWIARCAELDNSHRVDPAAGEVSALPARTTRRSAAVLGDAVRSDLEMEQIIASLGNDELYDPAHLALRNLAVIPDMISVTHGQVDGVFDDTNNLVDDPQSFYHPSPGLAEWVDDEVEIYKQRFAKYPKQFGHIAAGLPHKTQAQCVQFYYLHKKALINFREAVATYGQSKRRRGGRKTDKKKGGLLADIRQHDAEVSKGQNPVKPRPNTAGRKRRESARVAPRRSATVVQQEEQTPVTTPTPEPELESARPKRRRNIRLVTEPEPVGTEEPPPKRSRRAPRRPKLVPDALIPELKPLSKAVVEVPNGILDGQSEHSAPRSRSSAWSAGDIGQDTCELAEFIR